MPAGRAGLAFPRFPAVPARCGLISGLLVYPFRMNTALISIAVLLSFLAGCGRQRGQKTVQTNREAGHIASLPSASSSRPEPLAKAPAETQTLIPLQSRVRRHFPATPNLSSNRRKRPAPAQFRRRLLPRRRKADLRLKPGRTLIPRRPNYSFHPSPLAHRLQFLRLRLPRFQRLPSTPPRPSSSSQRSVVSERRPLNPLSPPGYTVCWDGFPDLNAFIRIPKPPKDMWRLDQFTRSA